MSQVDAHQQRLKVIDTQALITQYIAGKTLSQLAQQYGVSITAVHGLLRANGVSRKHRIKPPAPVDYDLDSMARHYREGKTYAEIAQLHNKSVWKTQKILQSNNIAQPRKVVTRAEREARVQEMIACYRSGSTLNEIAEKYKVTRQRIQQMFKNHDIARDDRGCRVCGATVEQQEQVHKTTSMPQTITVALGDRTAREKHITTLYKAGYTARDIGKLYSVSRQRVLQILVKHGVTSSDRGCPVCAHTTRVPRSSVQS